MGDGITVGESIAVHGLFRLFASVFESAGTRQAHVAERFSETLSQPDWASCEASRDLATVCAEAYPTLWQHYRSGSLPVTEDATRDSIAQWLASYSLGMAETIRHDLRALVRELGQAASPWWRPNAATAHVIECADRLIDARYVPLPAHHEVADTEQPNTPPEQGALRVWRKGKIRVRCVQVLAETHDVNTFLFEAVDGSAFEYLPGQSATLEVTIDGKAVRRTYTICSSPSRPHRLALTIKRVPNGLVSNWMPDNVLPGFEMDLRGPGGKFSWALQRARKVLFLSGGSGVTPLLSMSRYIQDRGEDADIVFWHAARAHRDVIAETELEMMCDRTPGFRTVFCFSRPLPEENWTGLTGYLSIEKLLATVPDFMERTIYLCGPVPFMRAAEGLLKDAAFPMEQFHQESFGGKPKQGKPPGAVETAEVPVEDRSGALAEGLPGWDELAESLPSGSLRNVPPVEDPWPDEAGSSVADEAAPGPSSSPVEGSAEGSSEAAVTYSVMFQTSEVKVEIDADTAILDAAEEAGLEVESSCRTGTCGTCKLRCVEGEVEMDEDSGLDDEDREAGYVLTCVGKARSALVLEA